MAIKLGKFKKLAINVGLAFLAGFITTLGVLLNSTPKAPTKAVLLSTVGASLFAGVRAAVGAAALLAKDIPAIPVDK
jgi:hypothetical protein